MNYLKEWEYPNLPSLKEISEQYEHESQVDFLNNQIKISAKENLFWAIRRKYYILALHSDIIRDLDKNDDTSLAIAQEIFEEFGRTSGPPIAYKDSCLPSYLLSIEKEVSKDAISVNISSVDYNTIEEFTNKMNLFFELRKSMYKMNTLLSLEDILKNEIKAAADESNQEINEDEIHLSADYKDKQISSLIQHVRLGILEGVSNFVLLLFTLIYQDFSGIVPRFSPAIHIDETREKKAFSILNNAVSLDISRDEKIKLSVEVFDLNPVDSSYYLNMIDLFPDLRDSIFSTSTFFAVPLRTDTILYQIAQKSEYSVEEAETLALNIAEFFDLPQRQLEKFREEFQKNAVNHFTSSVTVFSVQHKTPTIDDVVQLIKQLNTQLEKKQISLQTIKMQSADALSDLNTITTQSLNTFATDIIKNENNSYAVCMKQIDEAKDQLQLQGESIASADQAYDIVRTQFLNRIGQYADSLSIGEKSLTDCMEAVKQKFDEYEMPFDELSNVMEIRLTERAIVHIAKSISTNLGETEEDAKHCLETASQKCKTIGLSDEATKHALAPVSQRLSELDLQYRTVNGTVTGSREEADKLRDLDGLNIRLHFKGDYLYKIQMIQKTSISDTIKNERIAAMQKQLQELEEKCRKASRYNHFIRTKNRLWNGDSKDMIIHYIILVILILFSIFRYSSAHEKDMLITGIIICALYCCYMFIFKPTKEKKLWEEVTSNGQFNIEDILNDKKMSQSLS